MSLGRIPSKQLGASGASVSSLIEESVPCDSSVYLGSAVYMDAGVAKNAIANDVNKAKVIGVCVAKLSSTVCNIALNGLTGELYTGLDDKKYLFLSATVAGGLQQVPVSGAGQYIVPIGQPFTAKRVKINIQFSMQRA
jgi:hypothetical protein